MYYFSNFIVLNEIKKEPEPEPEFDYMAYANAYAGSLFTQNEEKKETKKEEEPVVEPDFDY